MESIYYSELVEFVNLENINLKQKVIRKGKQELDKSAYSPTHGLIQSHINALEDIANLDKSVLKYPMGAGIPMMLFNIIMQGKGILIELDKNVEIRISVNLGYDFSATLLIEENLNEFSKITISTDRILIATKNLSKESKVALDFIKNKFEALAKVHI